MFVTVTSVNENGDPSVALRAMEGRLRTVDDGILSPLSRRSEAKTDRNPFTHSVLVESGDSIAALQNGLLVLP